MSLLAEKQISSSDSPVGALSPPRPSRLLAGIYRDIGLAAVAFGLELPIESLDPDVIASVKRGARYIYLMPKGLPIAVTSWAGTPARN